MSIQHLVNPTINEELLDLNVKDIQCNQLQTPVLNSLTIVNEDTISTDELESNVINNTGTISTLNVISTNQNNSNTIRTKKLVLSDSQMFYDATKEETKIIGYINIIPGGVFKTITSQDTETHFVRHYKYIFGGLNNSSVSDFTFVIQCELEEYGDMILANSEFKMDRVVPVGSQDNFVFMGQVLQINIDTQQLTCTIFFSPNFPANQLCKFYLDFWMVKQK